MEFRKIAKMTDQEFRLRAPKEMVKILKFHAMKNGRSTNSEILYRLNWSLNVQEVK